MFFTAMSASYLHAGKAVYLVDGDSCWAKGPRIWRMWRNAVMPP
jgi:hypothetical protein